MWIKATPTKSFLKGSVTRAQARKFQDNVRVFLKRNEAPQSWESSFEGQKELNWMIMHYLEDWEWRFGGLKEGKEGQNASRAKPGPVLGGATPKFTEFFRRKCFERMFGTGYRLEPTLFLVFLGNSRFPFCLPSSVSFVF